MEKRLVIIAIQESNLKLVQQQLNIIFGHLIQIYGITLKELTHEKVQPNDVVLLITGEIKPIVMPFLQEGTEVLVAQRSENLFNMRELFMITEPKSILVVNDNYTNTIEVIVSLQKLLPLHTFTPYMTSKKMPDEIDLVITPGERDLIPKGFPDVYDIGSRIVSLETVFNIQEQMTLEIEQALLNKLYVKSMMYSEDDGIPTFDTPKAVDENKHRTFEQVQTHSALFSQSLQKAQQLDERDKLIHIEGEKGTGKQMMAEMIHNQFPFTKNAPFFTYNCLDKDPKMIQTELFGNDEKKGFLQSFSKGTFYMKNIDALPYTIQEDLAQICRSVLKNASSFTRFIFSTTRPLTKLYDEDVIHEALYPYLSLQTIWLPPLRERKEDLMTLMNDFKNHFHKRDLVFDQEAIQALMAYRWPGNIRELFNVISYCVCLETEYITAKTLPLIFKGNSEKLSVTSTEMDDMFVRDVITAIEQHGFLAESIALLEVYSNGKAKHEAYGRQKIKDLLKEKELYLTEQQLRLRIAILYEHGLVNVRKGRAGTTITKAGELFLKHYQEDQAGIEEGH